MNVIVAVDEKWGIGRNNDLLFRLKKDMRHFRAKTLNKVVAMGSNTLESLPGGRPLASRVNVVLRPGGPKRDDCVVCEDLNEVFETLAKYPSDDVFVIGGAMFYRTMLPYCDTAYVTKVARDGRAEVFFENLDELENWACVDEGETTDDGGCAIRFATYKNRNARKYVPA